MKSLNEISPDAAVLLALAPEELAGVVLEYINRLPESERRSQFHSSNFLEYGLADFPSHFRSGLQHAFMEAWGWLEHAGMIARSPGDNNGWMFLTRRGQRVKNAADLAALKHAELLPMPLTHPTIAAKCTSAFLHGEYDTAVFQAFKEVEVAVRSQGQFKDTDIGTDLMRSAFATKKGPLTEPNTPIAEQEATAHLFAGAIGLYKNPHSHRNVPLDDPAEAAALLIFASHLLNLVEGRALKQ